MCGFSQPWVPDNTTYKWCSFDSLQTFNARVVSYHLHGTGTYILLSNQQLVFQKYGHSAKLVSINFVPSHITCKEFSFLFANSSQFSVKQQFTEQFPNQVLAKQLQFIACTQKQLLFLFTMPCTATAIVQEASSLCRCINCYIMKN